ncbi:DUF1643 domain-containing protein [Actinacidiphila glaucinigra]|uniref:DUF1643 domain-containing protein n=1 Tax=Actinacidiphila glaucinigra TaxID=235986 RepID=UPI00339EED58
MYDAISEWAASHRLTVHDNGTLDLAVHDAAETYRYVLTWNWGLGPTITYVMLNPSTGTATANDATLRNCRAIAQHHGYGSLIVLNLFALRSREPQALYSYPDPIGPATDDALTQLLPLGDTVIVAWGRRHSDLHDRASTVAQLLYKKGVATQCLGINRDGTPRYVFRGSAMEPLASGLGMTVSPCRRNDLGGGVTGPGGVRRSR